LIFNKRYLWWFFASLLIIGGLSSCSKSGNKVIARVGDHKITADEFNDNFSRVGMTFPTAQDEYNKRREILDTMIVTRLLIQAAYEKHIDKSPELARVILQNKDKFLLDALYQKRIASKAKATEAELKDFYNHLKYKVRASHILVKNPDTAQMIFKKLKNGGNFEQLAYKYSMDPQAQRNKGDLGYFLWGAMVDKFQDVVFNMKPGEISPPFKTRYGYHIVKLVDKLPNEQRRDFDSMKKSIEAQIIKRKSFKLTEDFLNQIKVKYPITIDTSTCQYLLHKREQLYPPQLLKTLPKNDFDVKQLDRDEKELVLASWNGGQMTLNEYLTQVKNVPLKQRPNFDNYDSLATIVFELKKMDLLSLEAVREGLDNDKDYLKKMKLFKELNMADMMRNDSIPLPSPPTDDEVRKYYDDHNDEFTNPAKVHVYEILLSDELKAQRLAKKIKSLKEFKEKAKELTERPGKRSKSGDLDYIERKWYPEIFDLAVKTPIGAIGGPVVTGQKYSIFYVVDKIEPQLKDFLGVKRTIINKLKKKQKDEAFQKWVDERMKSTPIKIDEKALWATIDMTNYPQADSTKQK